MPAQLDRTLLLPAQVYRLLELSHRYGFHIVEDDLYCDLQQRSTPRLAAGGLDNVSYVSGFSKTLTANSRVSYAVLAPQLAARMIGLKMAARRRHDLGTRRANCLKHAQRRQLRQTHPRTVDRLYESSSRVTRWLEEADCTVSSQPHEGLFVWTCLPDGYHAETLTRKGLDIDLVLAPGTLLSKAPDASQYLRFNVAHSDNSQVRVRFFRC